MATETDDDGSRAADDDLARAVGELGPPDLLFQVGAGWFRAKLLVAAGLLLFGAAANYGWWVHGPGGFQHLVLHLLVWPPAVGAALLVHLYRQRGLSVLIYPTGLLRLKRGEVESFPWDEVTAVRLKVQAVETPVVARGPGGEPAACWLPAEVPTVQIWNARLTVERADGSATFGPAVSGYERLAEEVQRRTFPHLWADAKARVLAGEPVPFGDLSVYRDGLHHAGKFVRWGEVKEVTVSQGKLTVKRAGKWLPWAVLKDMTEVPNPHVLFALVEEFRKRAAPAPADPDADGEGDEPAG